MPRRKQLAFLLLGLLGAAVPAAPVLAERIAIESPTRASDVPRPHRGMTMEAVAQRFGEPSDRRAPVGDPPITRWTYPKFTVFFEYDRVIHAVVRR